MSQPVRIIITLEGGLISAVCTLGVPVEALIIDYDSEGADADEIDEIPQDRETVADAVTRIEAAEAAGPAVHGYALSRFAAMDAFANGEG